MSVTDTTHMLKKITTTKVSTLSIFYIFYGQVQLHHTRAGHSPVRTINLHTYDPIIVCMETNCTLNFYMK